MKVLIATDGSDYSQAAIDECCRMFRNSTDAEIEIIAVYELMLPPAGPYTLAPEYIQQVDDESRAQANTVTEKALSQIREKCQRLADKTITKVVCGAPAQQIVEESENWGADLIICGSHGYGFWKRAWMGSVSNALVHHAPCSVMVVRAKAEAQSAAAK
jgi:nucleotide-binding universal stress UspA family protein